MFAITAVCWASALLAKAPNRAQMASIRAMASLGHLLHDECACILISPRTSRISQFAQRLCCDRTATEVNHVFACFDQSPCHGRKLAIGQTSGLQSSSRKSPTAFGCRRSDFVASHDTHAFLHAVEVIGRKIRKGLCSSRRPDNFHMVGAGVICQAEVQPQIALLHITAATSYLVRLLRRARSYFHPRIERKFVALCSSQLETDPMIMRQSFGTKDHGLPFKILNYQIDSAVVKKIPRGYSSTDLRKPDTFTSELADIFELSVALVHEDQLRLLVL